MRWRTDVVTMKVTVSNIVIENWANQWWYEDPGSAERPNKWRSAKAFELALQEAQEVQRKPAILLMELTD
jgi:hypothetical protein